MSVGLLVGVVFACQLGCVGHEESAGRIPSASPSLIRAQAAQYAPPQLPAAPKSTRMVRGVTALAVAPQDVPPPDELEAWVQKLVQQGVTTVLLEIGSGPAFAGMASEQERPAGIYFRSQWATTIRDVFGELVPPAHQQGLSVFAAVSPRRMNWIDPTLGWLDRSYDVVHRQVRLSPYLDLFHPAFQEYLVGLLTDLADTGIDGILFQNDVALGAYDGFSAFGLRAFERAFQTRLDPAHLFAGVSAGQTATAGGGQSEPYPPEFWRWMGWKARERVKILERLGRAMRLHGTALQLALEIHPQAITDPRAALIRYGEDVLEAKGRFQYLVVRSSSQSQARGVSGNQRSAMIEQMKGLVGGAERIWMTVPVGTAEAEEIERTSHAERAELGKDIGLIYQRN